MRGPDLSGRPLMITNSRRILLLAHARAILRALSVLYNDWAGLVRTPSDDLKLEKNFASNQRKGDFTRSQCALEWVGRTSPDAFC